MLLIQKKSLIFGLTVVILYIYHMGVNVECDWSVLIIDNITSIVIGQNKHDFGWSDITLICLNFQTLTKKNTLKDLIFYEKWGK